MRWGRLVLLSSALLPLLGVSLPAANAAQPAGAGMWFNDVGTSGAVTVTIEYEFVEPGNGQMQVALTCTATAVPVDTDVVASTTIDDCYVLDVNNVKHQALVPVTAAGNQSADGFTFIVPAGPAQVCVVAHADETIPLGGVLHGSTCGAVTGA